jgi:hypothetical protein
MTRIAVLRSTLICAIAVGAATSIPADARFNYRPGGQRFASVTLKLGQGVRVTASNVLEPKLGSMATACPLLVRFFGAGGAMIGTAQEMELAPGSASSVSATPRPAGLVRAIISVKDFQNFKGDCAVKANFEVFDAATGATQVMVPGPECLVPSWPNLMLRTDKYLLPSFIAACVVDSDQIEGKDIRVRPGERFAPVTVVRGQGIRVTVANLLMPTDEAKPISCPLLVRFFGSDGLMIGPAHQVSLKAGDAISVSDASVPAGLVRAVVNIKDFSDPNGNCAVKANLEVFDAATDATKVLIAGDDCHGNGECIPPQPGEPPTGN